MKTTITNLQANFFKPVFFVLCIIAVCAGNFIKAQTLTNYSFVNSTETYTPITGGILLGSATVDDEVYVDSTSAGIAGVTTSTPSGSGFPIGFSFNFNGNIYDRLGISTNGWIGLGQSLLTPKVDITNAGGSGFFNPIISDGFGSQATVLQNRISALCTDLLGNTGSSIRLQTIGAAPSRICVIQWGGFRKYGSTADSFNFQIRLYEGTDSIKFVYGAFISDAVDGTPQVGLKTAAGYLSRTSASNWSATTASSSNTDVVVLTNSVKPANGTTFNWGMPSKTYISSTVDAPILTNVAPGSINEPVVRLKVVVGGLASSLKINGLTISTAGTTTLSEISSMKIFYTGSSTVFSTISQFSPTVFSPAASNVIIDSINLLTGDNYFWITYDISSSAVLGHFIDGAVTAINVGGTGFTPTVTSPAGSRQISSPMTYVSSTSTQPDLTKIQRGSTNNKILRIDVQTSLTGSPTNATVFDLSTNGSVNPSSNITNAKVWYTSGSTTFAATNQFGSTFTGPSGSFTISGSQALVNGLNYFWVTYDVPDTAVLGDSVDAEITAITIAGIAQTPTTTAPGGSRIIRAPFCSSTATSGGDEEILNVTFGSLNNSSTCTTVASGPGSTGQKYSNYTTTVTPPIISSGIATPVFITKGTCGGFYGEVIAVYIDYNQDGLFGTGENAFTSSYATGTANQVITSLITVPCTALSGNTLMRIVYVEGTSAPACGTYTWGETEDYLINIVNGPATYLSSSAIQVIGAVAAGTNDVAILRVPVKVTASSCNPGIITNVRFNTAGTTNVANIVSAKLYKTGINSVFNTNTLLGTLSAPSGQMVFSINDTANDDSNNYWLAYDLSSSAPNGNVIDARIDSLQAFGNYYTPANNNPSGNRMITIPMTYIGSSAIHPDLSKVETNSNNNRLLRILIRTGLTGSPINVTQFSLNTTGGGNDTANIRNAKIWYTGNSATFATTTQFGSTYLVPAPTASAWPAYSITGTQPLNNDSNYFWLTYDIKAFAVIGDSTDAEVTGITIGGIVQTPSISAPSGRRLIRNPFCASAAFFSDYDDIGQVTMTQGATTVLNNGTGCIPAQSNLNANKQYTDYTQLSAGNFLQNVPVNFNICDISGTTFTVGGYLGIFIDYNQNGIFDTGELAYASTAAQTTGHTGSFIIPCNSLSGNTRMRIIMQSYNAVTNSCLSASTNYYYGETEDYTINIVSNPIAYLSSTTIQQTGLTSAGAIDVAILRVPLKAMGCGVGIVSEMRFNITGTTSASNIVLAKLYKTGNSATFTNSNLLAQITSPTTQMIFSLNDTLLGLQNDTNNYWLAYDISSSASTTSNFVDGKFDSVMVVGSYRIPTISNPAGNKQITTPMTYVSSVASHPDLTRVEKGSVNNTILQIVINGSSTGSPINVTSMDLSTNGSATPATNISNGKVWYTGSSSTFNTNSQFGSTAVSPGGSFTINGFQPLLNGSNVFWVTYDIPSSAISGDSVDAEVVGMTIAGTSQVPSNAAPVGSRKIRSPYCTSTATNTGDEEILNVSFGTLNNSSTCITTAPGAGSVNQLYSNYKTTVAAPNISSGLPTTFSLTKGTCGGFYGEVIGVFIDYNQDGIFGTGENAYTSSYATGTANQVISSIITIPCTANGGLTLMRVVYAEATSVTACGTYGWGETEDYMINIVNQPATYTASTIVQITGSVTAGQFDVPVLRIPVKVIATPCLPGFFTQFNFNTTGTTATANIVSAKLYATGNNSTFNVNKLLGTVFSPSGSFSFTVSDTSLNDTNNYWLAYDISSSATNGNVLDARIDSIQAFGSWYIPANGNPTGSRIISVPMTYLSSTAIHPDFSKIQTGSTNNRILRVDVVTSATGAPVNVTNFDLSTNGSATPLSNITNTKIWYTGTSSTYSSTSQFGSTTTSPAGSYSVAGLQALTNGTNYFWITYDVPTTAVLNDSVDAELFAVMVDGISRTPIVSAPVGNRKIRAPYCISAATSTADEEIWGVTLGTLNNASTCTSTGGSGSTLNMYSDYSGTVSAPDIAKGTAIPITIYTGSCGGNYNSSLGIYIDLNQNGLFTDPGENMISFLSFTSSTLGINKTGNITIPCSALNGNTKMRIVFVEANAVNPCGTYSWGETEDYTINIISTPATYNSSSALQITGPVIASALDAPILRIPVKVSTTACLPGIISDFKFNTTGTTVTSNIISAKLYATGSSNTFNTTRLIGTVISPSGTFAFNVADTVVNDTNNYWLVYDVSASAANGNLLDARMDSLKVFGSWYIPSNGNPAGSRVVSVPMTYLSSTSGHPDLTFVEQNSANNRMLMIPVTTSATGAPVNVTNFNLSTIGSASPLSNISNAKVWYTGSNSNFASTSQFGSTTALPSGAFSVGGSQALINGVNYFWVTYDIPATAIIADSVDAAVTGIIVDGISQTPSVTSPTGNRKIRAPYCVPLYTSGCATDNIARVRLGSIDNVTGCTGAYTFYSNIAAPVLTQGNTYSLTLNYGSDGTQFAMVWIDYNNDGDYNDSGEDLPVQFPANAGSGGQSVVTFTVPLNSNLGNLRLRIRGGDDTQPAITQSCGASNSTYGESEEYTININAAPSLTYIWNGSASTDIMIAANWTPFRTTPNLNDKLLFNLGGAIILSNVTNTTVRVIELANATVVKLNGVTNNTIFATDSLVLAANTRINTGSLNVSIGNSITSAGILTGTGRVYGNLIHWINSTKTSPAFPLADSNGVNRNIALNYTSLPSVYGSVKASFIMGTPGNAGLPVTDAVASVTAKRAGVDGYWVMTSGLTGGTYTGTFNGTGFRGVNNYTSLVLLNRASNIGSWGLDGIHAATTGTNTAPVLNRTGMSAYGQYAIGGDTLANPLPVNLIFFNAKNVNGNVQLNWATASETNNKGFMIQRSVDGIIFTDLQFVNGKVNSNTTVSYTREDVSAFTTTGVKTLYYRLNQTDLDGNKHNSNIAMVSESDPLGDEVIVFPNPFESKVGLSIESASALLAQVQITDMQGRLISDEQIIVKAGSMYHELKNTDNLSNGIYMVRVNMNGVYKTIKVTKAN
ncbi:MAG: T9SS type A sorting domain-containing protein [Bacteroidia bacterium]|nr:T9SS type A sorting domain-containing protein [Bacteroidia bacterium]